MIHLHYNAESGLIKGIYNDSIHERIPSPTIVIDPKLQDLILKEPMCYRVDNRQLVQIAEHSKVTIAPRAKINDFEVDGCVYVVDRYLIDNIAINLAISSHDKNHSTKLWCQENGKWIHKLHNVAQLLEVAKAFDVKRINSNSKD